jgi:hypothetical protein
MKILKFLNKKISIKLPIYIIYSCGFYSIILFKLISFSITIVKGYQLYISIGSVSWEPIRISVGVPYIGITFLVSKYRYKKLKFKTNIEKNATEDKRTENRD